MEVYMTLLVCVAACSYSTVVLCQEDCKFEDAEAREL